jgi:hypothetical protein
VLGLPTTVGGARRCLAASRRDLHMRTDPTRGAWVTGKA